LISRLLVDRDQAGRLGRAAVDRVVTDYLAPRYLTSYLALVDRILP